MKKILIFIVKLISEIKKDDVIAISHELTYKLLLALFPFIIFAMSVLGFLELDSRIFFQNIELNLPKQIMDLINIFIHEVIDEKNGKILSSSLIISLVSASSGFNAVIRGINRAYGEEDKRGFIKKRLLSVALVIIFCFSLVGSVFVLIFRENIKEMLLEIDIAPRVINALFGFSTYICTILILLIVTMTIYKLSSFKKVKWMSVFPGAFVTVMFWIISSKIFNVYITNFSKYSKVYGSIGSVFILMLWINLISFLLLLGSEINALLKIEEDM